MDSYWFTFQLLSTDGNFCLLAAEEKMDALFEWHVSDEALHNLTRHLLPFVIPADYPVTVCNFNGTDGIMELIACDDVNQMMQVLNYRNN